MNLNLTTILLGKKQINEIQLQLSVTKCGHNDFVVKFNEFVSTRKSEFKSNQSFSLFI